MRSALICVATLTLVSVFAGCKSAPESKPLDQLTAQESHGHDVFTAHCSGCHYDRTAQPLNGPGLRGVFKKQFLPSGAPANDDRVAATIQHGRIMMPAQPDLGGENLNDLLAYLHTL